LRPASGGAAAADKIGELNSYSRMAAFAVPYRNAMQLAQDEINQAGGVLGGRKLEFVFRDDGGTTGDATRVAEELVTRENVAFLVGTFCRMSGSRSRFRQPAENPVPRLRTAVDAITMAQGNRYTFRVRPSTFMQTKMLVEAVKDNPSRAGRSSRRTTNTGSRRRRISSASSRRRTRRPRSWRNSIRRSAASRPARP
jgi:branched-chain amino acid transport system substrate-binding protein